MNEYSEDYLLNKRIRILQPLNGYRASTDAVFLASIIENVKPNDNILDVGSGTGAVSLCLAHHFPQNSIIGLELQPKLAELSQKSAAINGFNNLTYYNADISGKTLPIKPCSFNHVITNPPYYEQGSLSPNQGKALAHTHHNIDLAGWIRFCLKMLKPFGHFYIINRVETLDTILGVLNGKAGNIKILPFYSKPEQNAKRILLSAQKDSKTPTTILPPFYAHTTEGKHTTKSEQILKDGLLFFES